MATIKDLTDWVDLHPDDHEQRWWLAKKLYKNSEYEAALEHLLLLRKRWKPKLNVARYLAATYYRLGKYPEAIAELEQAVEDWPEEIPVREQLARVLEVAGRKEGAATVWREVLKLKPGHTMAEQALARLPRMTPPPKEVPALKDADFGIGFGSGRTCDKCGALNTEEREKCWKCSADLYTYDAEPIKPDRKSTAPHPELEEEAPLAHATAVWNTVGTVGIAVMLALGAFLSLRQFSASYEMHVAKTTQEFWTLGLLLTRVAIGAALLAGWPIALWVALMISRVGAFTLKPVVVTGLLFASLSYAALSLPLGYVAAILVALMAVSLGPVMLLFNIDFARSLIVWLVQCVLVGAVVLIAFGAMEGAMAVQELPAVLRYAGTHDTEQNPGSYPLPSLQLPAELKVRWQSTGSSWLDQRAGQAEFVFSNTTSSKKIQVELMDENGKPVHEEINAVPFRFQAKIVPDHTYTLKVSGSDGMTVEGSVLGAITPKFTG
ncbi:MAG: tetratricopeptide repeat protein [Candidatus Hydrogenedentes bacterium]|nr:tetratricopeptide repeat protein [Candidatus Hydrogenedentota bacterium]